MSRLLAKPHPIRMVIGDDGRPAMLSWQRGREPVTVCNHWRVEGDWWRQQVAREYYRLLTKSGSVCTVYRDSGDGYWYLERTLD